MLKRLITTYLLLFAIPVFPQADYQSVLNGYKTCSVSQSEKPLNLDTRFLNELSTEIGYTKEDIQYFKSRLSKVSNLTQSYELIPCVTEDLLLNYYISPVLQHLMHCYDIELIAPALEALENESFDNLTAQTMLYQTRKSKSEAVFYLAIGNSFYDLDSQSRWKILSCNALDNPRVLTVLSDLGYSSNDIKNYGINVAGIKCVANYLYCKIYNKPTDGFEHIVSSLSILLPTIQGIVSTFEHQYPGTLYKRSDVLNFKDINSISGEFFLRNNIYTEFKW